MCDIYVYRDTQRCNSGSVSFSLIVSFSPGPEVPAGAGKSPEGKPAAQGKGPGGPKPADTGTV